MTITIAYTPEVKKQAKNPFARMTPVTGNRCHGLIRKRLLWLAQLSSSQNSDDVRFYSAMTQADRELFGRAPEYDNKPNTGLAVLAGAVEKMYSGDLSMKQIKYITPVLDLMAECYPTLWEKITFVSTHQDTHEITTPFESLFE
jgi:hypothetical protein